MRSPARRTAASGCLAAFALLLAAGCAVAPGPVQAVGPVPEPVATSGDGEGGLVPPDPDAPRLRVQLVAADGTLVAADRPAPSVEDPLVAAVLALGAPPLPDELEAGHRSRVPRGTTLVRTGRSEDTRWAVLTAELDGGGTERTRADAVRQLVCTLAEHDPEGRPDVVELQVEGRVLARREPADCA
ncbi:hypothetical protein FTX61_15210 [Nitriliruptoraceae bacterium ZYF776]|nr:hypothetical protein [Profundirhabdus halotolerans]